MISKRTLKIAQIAQAVFLTLFFVFATALCLKYVEFWCTEIALVDGKLKTIKNYNMRAIIPMIIVTLLFVGTVASVLRIFINRFWIRTVAVF